MQHWELGDDSASYRQLVARFVSMMTRSGLTARVHGMSSSRCQLNQESRLTGVLHERSIIFSLSRT